jgi:hypothetical protein
VSPVKEPPIQVKPIVQEPTIPIAEEPVKVSAPQPKAAPKEEKPVIVAPRVAKPVTARLVAPPRPVHHVEKPVVIAPQVPARKNAGSADLARAREAVSKGDIATALRRYIKLINSNKALDNVSSDLKELVRKNPKNYLAWQTFGDARLRSNRIQEALDAYAKAADLLK